MSREAERMSLLAPAQDALWQAAEEARHDGWDGYSAAKVQAGALEQARRLLLLLPAGSPQPEIGPTARSFWSGTSPRDGFYPRPSTVTASFRTRASSEATRCMGGNSLWTWFRSP